MLILSGLHDNWTISVFLDNFYKDLQPTCAEYGFETLIIPSVEIPVLAVDLQSICHEYELETWLATNE